MSQLVFNVKQGEDINIDFTIKKDGSPLNLTGATIKFQVKRSPSLSCSSMVEKVITESTDLETIGQITNAPAGQLSVRLLPADTSFSPNDYYAVIWLIANGNEDIISSSNCGEAIYRICTQ